jgi:scytalone dehydratase
MISNPLFLGDPLVDSQHFIGAASKWVKVSDTEITGCHQSRAAHIRWTDETKSGVAAKGHGHGNIRIEYQKVDGVWKWAGIKTHVRWNEHDWSKIFKGLDGK